MSRGSIFFGWSALLWGSALALMPPVSAFDTIVLETVTNGPTRIVAGNPKLADARFPPASTFKMVLAWAALETKTASPASTFKVADSHVPGAPRTLTLPEAMFYSSNDAFVELAGRLPKERLEEFVAHSGFAGGPPPKDWLKEGFASVRRGGALRVTPRLEHAFILRVLRGELASSKKIQDQLLACLAWPAERATVRVYGKTGSLDAVRWFNGFGIEGKTDRAVTVLSVGANATREDVVAAFYARFALPPPKLKE